MLILALLKKNLRHGYWVGSLVLIALGAVLAFFMKGKNGVEREVVPLAAFAMAMFGAIAGSAAFSADLQKEGVRFLEYLPVRPIQVYLANVLEGLLTVAAFVGATWLFRAVTFSSNDIESAIHGTILNRADFLLFGLLPALLAFSVGAFARVASVRGQVASGVSVMAIFAFELSLVGYASLSPSPSDLAGIVFLLSALFLGAGALFFVFVPPHRAGWPLRLLAGFGGGLLAVGFGVLVSLFVFSRWIELRPDETKATNTLTQSNGPVWAVVEGSRSGRHAMSLDPETGSATVFGREMTPVEVIGPEASGSTSKAGERWFVTRFQDHAIFPGDECLVAMSADGRTSRTVLTLTERESDQVIERSHFTIFPSRGTLVFIEHTSEGTNPATVLAIADLSGRVLDRVTVSAYSDYWAAENGRILAEITHNADRGPFGVYDLASRRSYTIPLSTDRANHGYRFNAELTKVLYVDEKEVDRRIDRTLVLVDLDTQARLGTIGPDLTPPANLESPEESRMGARSALAQVLPPPRQVHLYDNDRNHSRLPCAFDAELDGGACLVRVRHGDDIGFALYTFDLVHGTHREVMSDDNLPHFPIDQVPSPMVAAYTKAAVVFRIAGAIHRFDLARGMDARFNELNEHDGYSTSSDLVFSPGLERAYRTRTSFGDGVARDKLEVVGPEGARVVFERTGRSRAEALWLDDRRLLVGGDDGISVIGADDDTHRLVWSSH